jgi:hypothetical protein
MHAVIAALVRGITAGPLASKDAPRLARLADERLLIDFLCRWRRGRDSNPR